jgi:two-component system sensor histidine kinase/response regulator
MKTYEQRVPILEFLYKKPGVNLSGFTEETPNNLNELLRSAFDDLQRSELQLSEHVASLQAKNEELEAYASTVAHDLKEPLAVMILTANLMTKIPDITHAELNEYLGQIRSTAYQMNTIITTMLLFAKVSKSEAPMEQVDMAQVVTNVLNRLSTMIRDGQAQIELPDSWPVAMGYAPWLEEVWTNYLSNALKHGGQPPQVELGASVQTDGMVRFWMRDHGPVISADAQVKIFSPFSQTDLVCNPSHGLGLSIVQRIVEKLGGQVGFESETGKGSLFFFTLRMDTQVTR